MSCAPATGCAVCPKDQTVVYAYDKASPADGYNPGSCTAGGTGGGCTGTHWKCTKVTCDDGKAVVPAKYQNEGNWCKGATSKVNDP